MMLMILYCFDWLLIICNGFVVNLLLLFCIFKDEFLYLCYFVGVELYLIFFIDVGCVFFILF